MAIIYSYPENNNILPTDILVCTSTALINGKPKNQTKNISIADLTAFMALNGDNLNDILTNGNTSLLSANIGQLGLFDAQAQNYGSLELSSSEFNFYNTSNVLTSALTSDSLILYPNSYSGQLLVPNTVTADRVYTFQDASGTVAFLSNIPVVTTPNLQTVLTAGNISQIDAFVGNIGLYNNHAPSGNGYVSITGSKNLFHFYNNIGTEYAQISQDTLTLLDSSSPLFVMGIKKPATITATRIATFQDASGTIAYLSNIPVVTGFVPYTGATQAVNLGAFNLTVNGISFGKGAGTGTFNIANGTDALISNTIGSSNTAIGKSSLRDNISGSVNTAVGSNSLRFKAAGDYNTAIGSDAGLVIGNGVDLNQTSNFSVYLGSNTKPLLNNQTNQIVIGYNATGAGSDTVTIGNTSITTTRLRGNVQGGTFVKDGGLSTQYLMADGSVTTGGGGGSVTLSAIGSTPNANGATLTGSALNLEPASASFGGVVTTGVQTFAGAKAFNSSVTAGSFIKSGGTSTQYLMADGSVTTVPYKYNFSGSLTLTGTLTTTNLLTITIPANSLTDYLDLRSVMVQQSGPTLAGFQIRVWHNSVNDFNTATRIANFAFGAGGADLFAQLTRKFSIQSGTLFGFSATPSNATGDGSNPTAALSIAFNPAAVNYLFVSVQLNNVTDTATLRNVNITT